jgi:hypothetical protein
MKKDEEIALRAEKRFQDTTLMSFYHQKWDSSAIASGAMLVR